MSTTSIAVLVLGAGAAGAGAYRAGTAVARAPWSWRMVLWSAVGAALVAGALVWLQEVSQ